MVAKLSFVLYAPLLLGVLAATFLVNVNSQKIWVKPFLTGMLVSAMFCVVGAVLGWIVFRPMVLALGSARRALGEYRVRGTVSKLPEDRGDELGALMRDINALTHESAAVRRRLETDSLVDTLTGISNRRSAQQRLEEEVATAKRHGFSLTLCFIDANGLKQVNDRFGHDVGDAYITLIARSMTQSIRAGDWCARWGGDEFIAVLRNADDAGSFAERVERSIAEDSVDLPIDENVPLSVSIGWAGFAAHMTTSELLAQADRAMYEAKRSHHREVKFAAPSPSFSNAALIA